MSPEATGDVLRRRRGIVEALRTGDRRRSELVSALDTSRSTVDRATRELRTYGLVERERDRFRLTSLGRLLVGTIDATERTIDDVVGARSVLAALDAEAPLAVDVLTGAAVYEPTTPAPYDVLQHSVELVYAADAVHGLIPALMHGGERSAIYRTVMDGSLRAELVYEPDVVEYMRRYQREDRREMLSTGRYRPFEVRSLPFGLLLTEDDAGRAQVCVLVYDDDDQFEGLIVNESPEALAWGTRVYEAYRAGAADVADRFRSAEETA